MNAITIKKLSKETLAKLEARAHANRRSINDEAADIIGLIVGADRAEPRPGDKGLRKAFEEIAAMSANVAQTDSLEDLRGARNR